MFSAKQAILRQWNLMTNDICSAPMRCDDVDERPAFYLDLLFKPSQCVFTRKFKPEVTGYVPSRGTPPFSCQTTINTCSVC